MHNITIKFQTEDIAKDAAGKFMELFSKLGFDAVAHVDNSKLEFSWDAQYSAEQFSNVIWLYALAYNWFPYHEE